ncbi:hypothetical protein PPL_05635 [Heterostelium album PN500]|uniref:Lipase n=1 Tax=Heterostelium pallidum (strain ATCC 26659 / Pp 5 / PN500) TaxID=670386 RepID=D3BAQ5_HETP5|nr:hypothetical protein PPL_05635 [Heterostelium album PN500]EFA81642.1 hypothetical protein PPL_05635 [Heterostelium album PN500]|eukprot:XP_020433759.1 hypothetical protein PPL_05635 [Heterostelium album PN500]
MRLSTPVLINLTLLITIIYVSLAIQLPKQSTTHVEWDSNDPDLKRNISQLIVARGYPEEDHHVVTPDGFIRIPAGRYKANPNPYGANGKAAIVLQHGVEDIGTSWVIQENVYQSFGFILADAGFDVWISNVRGTTYSNSSINTNPSEKAFWAWSFDQMAEYDLPTILDYVRGVTNNEQVGYVGHSQGTTMGFIGFANETIAAKINLFVALAPVVRVTHCQSALLDVLADFDIVDILELLGEKAFLPDTPTLQHLLPIICGNDPSLCSNSLALIMGWDTSNINNTRLPVIMAHEPGGTSVQNVAHWAQAKKHGYYKFNYGPIGNLQHYGQLTAPAYNISEFRAPVIFYYGGNDYLADPTDVEWLIPQVPSLLYKKFLPTYSHLDFVWGENAYQDIYDEAAQWLLKYATYPNSK